MKRLHWRYSLSTLLILTTLCAIVAYYYGQKFQRERRMENAWAYLDQMQSPKVAQFSARDGYQAWLVIAESDTPADIFKDSTIKALHDCEGIDGVSLDTKSRLSDDQYRQLFSLPALQFINCDAHHLFTLSEMKCLIASAPNLIHLTFNGPATSDALSKISDLNQLEALDIQYIGNEENDEGPKNGEMSKEVDLASMPSLKHMSITWPEDVMIRSMPRLNECNVGGKDKCITTSLETCPELRSLVVGSTLFSKLDPQPALKSLSIYNVRISAEDVNRLNTICKPDDLQISSCELTQESIARLKVFSTLRKLKVQCKGGFDEAPHENPQQLFEPPHIEFGPTLARPKLNWSVLAECKNIESLSLGCEIDDVEELRFLSKMTNLKKLTLADVRVASPMKGYSNRALLLSELIEKISPLSFLDELVVRDIDLDASIIKARLPKTKITTGS